MEWENNLIREVVWSGEMINRETKEAVAEKIAWQAREGEVIGVGSGSTVYLALEALARRINRENLHVRVIPASLETTMACVRLGVPLLSLYEQQPDWTFDGADEVDPGHNLIKGRGGAMFKEKLLISSSRKVFIIVDETKLVEQLGTKFPIPVEVFPGALTYVGDTIKKLGAVEIWLRSSKGKDGPVITENGHLILDVRFDRIYPTLENEIKNITGVIESGLFMGYPLEVVLAM